MFVATRPTAATTTAAPPSSVARRVGAPRRAVTVTAINYSYLRHDLTLLAVLAPLMVVLVIVAFIFEGVFPG